VGIKKPGEGNLHPAKHVNDRVMILGSQRLRFVSELPSWELSSFARDTYSSEITLPELIPVPFEVFPPRKQASFSQPGRAIGRATSPEKSH
jgi:hypothetical protein